MYYHNFSSAFYALNRELGLDLKADEIDTITYATIYKDKDGFQYKLTPLGFNDFVDEKGFFFEDYCQYLELVDIIKHSQDRYLETFSTKEINIELFGKNYTFGFEKDKLSTAVLTCSLDYLIKKDKYHKEQSEEIFEIIVKDTVANSNMFEGERFANNLREAVKNYWSENSAMRSTFSNIFEFNTHTMLMYTVWKYLQSEGVFENEVIGVDQILQDPSFLITQLSTLQYVESFLSTISEGYEQASNCKEDINNFENGFEIYGGGRGIGGAIGGILAATFVSAVAHTAYSAYKSTKIDSKKYNDIIEEFMVSKASQAFFKELIETDFIYLILKCFKSANEMLQDLEFYRNYEKHIDYEKMFEAYIKAYKLYTIALAKHLKLVFLPVYEGFEESHKKTSVQLMQEVLELFPYYGKYYEKYIEFGGEMSEELKIYASAHMIDLTDLYKNEVERREKKKQEEAEKKKREAERKRKQEEKRKKEEERIKNELSSISEIYGDLPLQYPKVFEMLVDNPIFVENKGVEITDHIKIADAVFRYLSTIYSSDEYTNLFSGTSEKFNSKKRNIKTIHGEDKIKDNNVLLLFDTTVFGSAKDGFVITNENICVHNSFEHPFAVAIKDVQKLLIKEKCLLINDNYRVDIGVSCVKPEEFVHIFSYCICNLLYLAKNGYQIVTPVVADTTSQSNTSVENQFVNIATGAVRSFLGKIGSAIESITVTQTTWKCSCGKDVSSENKFCPNCGTKQPEVITEWLCPSCGKKNSKDSNFCGQCGTKRDG